MTNSNKLTGKTDEQLKELKASFDQAAQFCTQQQNVFWGKGVHDGADMFAKNAESFDEQSQAIQEELDSRALTQENLTKEQKKSLEEQPVYPPANLKPADQPKPATQPVELSTEAQKQQQSENKQQSSSSNKA